MNSKDFSIEEALEQLFKFFLKYIDYFESDLGAFLTYKSFKKYILYILLRVIFIFLYLSGLFLTIFLQASFISFIFMIIAFSTLFAFYNVDKLLHKKYKYTSYFFQDIKKRLVKYKIKLDLILNNTYLSEEYNKDKFDFEVFKNKSNKLKERIENDIGIIKSYSYYLKKFALPSILFAPIITIIINMIYNLVQNPIPVNIDAINRLFLGLVTFSLISYEIITTIISVKKSRKIKKTSIYLFLEGLIITLLEFLRLNLRIKQFPKEEKLKENLLNVMKEIVKKLEHDSTKN